jgi:hypothetical protein
VRHRKAETLPKGLGIMSYRIAGKRRTGGPELRRVRESPPMLLWVLAMPSGRCISTFPCVYADAAYHRYKVGKLLGTGGSGELNCYALCFIFVPRVDLSQCLTPICTTRPPYRCLPDLPRELPLSQYLAVSFHKRYCSPTTYLPI